MKLLFSLIMVFMCQYAHAQNEISTKFDFPIKAGDAKWNSYKTSYERNQVLQIPREKLGKLSTRELLRICLQYPYLIEATFYTNSEDGINYLKSNFNGFQELLTRNDLAEILLEKEANLAKDFEALKSASLEEKGRFSYENYVVKLLLKQDIVTRSFNESQIKELLTELNSDMTLQKQHPEVFGSINEKIINELLSLNNGVLYRFNPSYSSVTIYTPENTAVPNAKSYTGEDVTNSPAEIAELSSHLYTAYNGATIVDNCTWKYDAPGWTWHKSVNNSNVCIHNHGEAVYWQDGSYIPVPQQLASRAAYGYNNDFSAVIESSNWFISKWGDGGPRVKHHPTSLPNGSDSFFGDLNYYPNGPITYYMRNPHCSINGAPLIKSGSATYSVNNLPSGCSVTWSLSDSYYNQNGLQQNTPSVNQCRITYLNGNYMKYGVLTAVVKYGGTTILTLTKTVSATPNFVGHYTSGTISREVLLPAPLEVKSGTVVSITSPNLIGATVQYRTQNTAIPTSWYHNSVQGTLSVGMPSNSIIPVLVDVTDSFGSQYNLVLLPSSLSSINADVSTEDDYIEVRILDFESGYDVAESMNKSANNECQDCQIKISNGSSGKIYATSHAEGRITRISTVGWPKGIYIVQVIRGKESVSKKVAIL